MAEKDALDPRAINVMPTYEAKTRSIDRIIASLSQDVLHTSSLPFFDFTNDKCQCWGLAHSFHSPFFCPADHSKRVLPKGRKTWQGGVFYPFKRRSWCGYGMGGAGDNAGGYLGGSYVTDPHISATQMACIANQQRNIALMHCLPGGISAIGGLPKALSKPIRNGVSLLGDAFDLNKIVDQKTGRLLHPEQFPADASGNPVVPAKLRKQILSTAKLVGGGRPGLMTRRKGSSSNLRTPGGASMFSSQSNLLQGMQRTGVTGLQPKQRSLGPMPLASFYSLAVPGAPPSSIDRLGMDNLSHWLNSLSDQPNQLDFREEDPATVMNSLDPHIERDGYEDGGVSRLQGLLSGGNSLSYHRPIYEGYTETTNNGESMDLLTSADVENMDMGSLYEYLGDSSFGQPTANTNDDLMATAKGGLAAAEDIQDNTETEKSESARLKQMEQKIKRLKEIRRDIAEGKLTIEDILAAHERIVSLAGPAHQKDDIVSVKEGVELISAADRQHLASLQNQGAASIADAEAKTGVAHVEVKKTQPPKPPPGGKKPPPPPSSGGGPKKKPPPKKAEGGVGKKKAGAGSRMRRMPWDPLANVEETKFPEIEVLPLTIDKSQVMTDFSLEKKVAEGAAQQEAKKKQEVIKLLPDQKRSYTMSIATARIRKLGYDKLKAAIMTLDPVVLTPDVCSTLIEYSPLPEEIQAVEAFVNGGGDISKCDSPEQFVYALKDIKDLKPKLQAHAFSLSFSQEVEELSIPVEKLKAAIDALRKSKRLPRFLFLVVRIGNIINGTDIKGIRLTSVPKLIEYKTTAKPVRNLLQYIAHLIYYGPDQPLAAQTAEVLSYMSPLEAIESLDLMDEMREVAEGAKIDLEGIEQRIQKLGAELKKSTAQVEKLAATDAAVDANLSGFIKSASNRLKALEKLLTQVKGDFNDVAMLYGETPESLKKLTLSTYLGFPARLARELQAVVKDIKDKREREAKRMAAKAGPPKKMAPAKAPPPAAKKPVMRVRVDQADEPNVKVIGGSMPS